MKIGNFNGRGGTSMAGKISLLLVEDDIVDADFVTQSLGQIGNDTFAVTHVERLMDSAELVAKRSFNVVMVGAASLNHPSASRIVKMLDQSPLIVLMSWSDDVAAMRSIDLGAHEFVYKEEIEPRRLIRAIRHAIKRHQCQSGASRSADDEQRLAELGKIVEDTSQSVTQNLDELRSTKLDEGQLGIVSKIEDVSRQSLIAARKATLGEAVPEAIVENAGLR